MLRFLKLVVIVIELLVLAHFFRTADAAPAVVLLNGPIAGAVTDTAATIWLRTNKAADVFVRYSPDPNLANALSSAVVRPNQNTKFSVKIRLTGLEPQTMYYYQIVVDNVPKHQPPLLPNFATFAPRGTAVDFHFGVLTDFGSYHATKPETPLPLATFQRLAAENPAFVVIGGDFWHNDQVSQPLPVSGRSEFVARTRQRFYQMYSHNSTQGPYDDFVDFILPHFALAHFWDDHDIGSNNSNRFFMYKADSLRVLAESFPTYPMTQHGDWQKFSYGQVDFFILDARSERDPNLTPDGPNKSMLDGDKLGKKGQYAWLTNQLAASQARWKIIFTPVVFNPTLKKMDAWRGFQYERTRLVNFIRDHAIQGVLFISGDAHAGALDDGTNADFPEMLVPGPNMRSSCFTATGTGVWSHGIYGQLGNQRCAGYGMVYIYTHPDRAVFQVKDEDGNLKLEMEVR